MRLRAPGAAAALALLLLTGPRTATLAQDRHPPVPVEGAPVEGMWITAEGDGVFQIGACGDRLCGRLVGMRYRGAMPLDILKHPQCRERLLTGFRPGIADGHWVGSILDPDDGRSYDATIWSPHPGVLKLRGYLLLPLFGETRTWTRYAGMIGAACRLPDRS